MTDDDVEDAERGDANERGDEREHEWLHLVDRPRDALPVREQDDAPDRGFESAVAED